MNWFSAVFCFVLFFADICNFISADFFVLNYFQHFILGCEDKNQSPTSTS